MSRITGTDAFNMMEAYNAVYAPQEEVELTEEQIQEDFENWVNSLVEEGHDLSEYTWEDMYEAYLGEMGQPGGNRPGGSRPITNAPYQSRFARPMNANTPRQTGRATSVSRPQIGGLPTNYRGQELQQAARARASQVGTPRQGTAGGPTTGGNTPIGTTRPTATAPARPAAAPVRPAATSAAPARSVATAPQSQKPALTQTTTTTTAPAAPARPSLRSGIEDLQKMRLASQERQRKGGATVVGSQMSSFDPFDIVKGYLIDEGYADTEEAAFTIMANMSEEWKTEILESGYFPTKESQRKDEAKYDLSGQMVKPKKSTKPSK
jgi:hypothetical protein